MLDKDLQIILVIEEKRCQVVQKGPAAIRRAPITDHLRVLTQNVALPEIVMLSGKGHAGEFLDELVSARQETLGDIDMPVNNV